MKAKLIFIFLIILSGTSHPIFADSPKPIIIHHSEVTDACRRGLNYVQDSSLNPGNWTARTFSMSPKDIGELPLFNQAESPEDLFAILLYKNFFAKAKRRSDKKTKKKALYDILREVAERPSSYALFNADDLNNSGLHSTYGKRIEDVKVKDAYRHLILILQDDLESLSENENSHTYRVRVAEFLKSKGVKLGLELASIATWIFLWETSMNYMHYHHLVFPWGHDDIPQLIAPPSAPTATLNNSATSAETSPLAAAVSR